MQVIAAVVDRQHAGGMLRIAHALVEIDHRVERAGVPDPCVHRLADRLARRRPGAHQERLVLERRQRAAEYPDPARMRAHRHLLQAGDHLFGGHFLLGLGPAVAQIVGPEQHDHMRDAGLRQNVAVEAAQAAVAADVVQDAVAAEPLVHHAQRAAVAARDQPPRKLVRPAAECVMRGDIGVGQRVAECHDAAGLHVGHNVDAVDEIPIVGQPPDRHHILAGKIPRRRDVIRLARIAAGDAETRRHVARQVDADRNIGQRRHRKIDRIAHQQRTDGDGGRTLAAERQPAVGARHDAGAACTQADPCRADVAAVGCRTHSTAAHAACARRC